MTITFLDYNSWIRGFPLRPFRQEVDKLRMHAEKLEGSKCYHFTQDEFHAIIRDISQFIRHIGYIIRRLNEHLQFYLNANFTPKSIEQLFLQGGPGDILNLINIDLISLFLFIRILMDKISRLLYNITYGEQKPSLNRFVKWKEDIEKYKDNEIDELKKIINGTNWFDELKKVRDDCIVHHGRTSSGVAVLHGKEFGVFIQSYSRERDIFYSYKKINELCQNAYQFIEELNDYLCDNFEELPIKIIKISE